MSLKRFVCVCDVTVSDVCVKFILHCRRHATVKRALKTELFRRSYDTR